MEGQREASREDGDKHQIGKCNILAWTMFNFDLKFRWNDREKPRYFLLANIVLMGGGILSLAVGIWLYCSKNDFVELTPSSYSALSAAGLCVFSGVTVCIITGVGYLAVTWSNRKLLYSYILFILLLIIIHFLARMTGFLHKDEARENLRKSMLRNINTTAVITTIGREIKLSVTWDHLQRELECCGVDTYTDWHYSVHWPLNVYLPDSCCDPQHFGPESDIASCGKVPEAEQYVYKEGCFPKFADWLYHHIIFVNWVTSILLVIEVTTLVLSFYILGLLKKQDSQEKRRRERRERNEESVERFRLNSMDRIGDAREDLEESRAGASSF